MICDSRSRFNVSYNSRYTINFLLPSSLLTILKDFALELCKTLLMLVREASACSVIKSRISCRAAWNLSRSFHSERDQCALYHRTSNSSRKTAYLPEIQFSQYTSLSTIFNLIIWYFFYSFKQIDNTLPYFLKFTNRVAAFQKAGIS